MLLNSINVAIYVKLEWRQRRPYRSRALSYYFLSANRFTLSFSAFLTFACSSRGDGGIAAAASIQALHDDCFWSTVCGFLLYSLMSFVFLQRKHVLLLIMYSLRGLEKVIQLTYHNKYIGFKCLLITHLPRTGYHLQDRRT